MTSQKINIDLLLSNAAKLVEQKEEQLQMEQAKKSEIIAELVKMADKLDQAGKPELAEEIDKLLSPAELTVEAARNKAPLKELNEGVKRDLISFLFTARKNIADSHAALKEFASRLRYFDASFAISELDLPWLSESLQEVETKVDIASKQFYEYVAGRKPRNNEIEDMVNDKAVAQKPEEFFAAQKNVVPEEKAHDENCAEDCECRDVKTEEVEDFWK